MPSAAENHMCKMYEIVNKTSKIFNVSIYSTFVKNVMKFLRELCPNRNLAVFHHYRHYEGLRLLPSVCEQIIIQQTLINIY